jgi:hypothetical protein
MTEKSPKSVVFGQNRLYDVVRHALAGVWQVMEHGFIPLPMLYPHFNY